MATRKADDNLDVVVMVQNGLDDPILLSDPLEIDLDTVVYFDVEKVGSQVRYVRPVGEHSVGYVL